MPHRRHAALKLATLPIHPFLLAAAVVLHFALEASVHVHAVVRPFGVALVGVAVLLAALSLLLRNRHVGGIATSALLVVLLARWFWALNRGVLEMAAAWQAAVWFALLAATALLAGWILRRASRSWSWPAVTRRANVFAAALLVVVLGSAVVDGSAAQAVDDLARPEASARDAAGSPDIIVLLLDGYPRADTLERIFGLDNTPFIAALEERGFEVSDASRSNYAATQLTLMSMFHMTHLVDLPAYRDVLEGRVGEDPRVRNLINDNPVLDRLGELGYSTVSVPPGIERVTLRSVDATYDTAHLNEFEYHLLRSTALGGLWATVDPAYMARGHRERVLAGIERVEQLAAETPGGRFIFAHVLSPHMPAVLERDGSLNPVPYTDEFFFDSRANLGTSLEDFVADYRDQLLALNDRVIGMLDTVVAENPDAVVVLFSDHGSAAQFETQDIDSDLDERFSNLFAARTPGHAGVFTESQTPVNVFPRLFNAYFGTDLPLQADATYFGVTTLTLVDLPDAPRDAAASSGD